MNPKPGSALAPRLGARRLAAKSGGVVPGATRQGRSSQVRRRSRNPSTDPTRVAPVGKAPAAAKQGGGQEPRATQESRCGASAARVVDGPWPVCTMVFGDSTKRRSRIEAMRVGKSENDRPVAPGPSLNNVSPPKRCSVGPRRHTPPGLWPGVWMGPAVEYRPRAALGRRGAPRPAGGPGRRGPRGPDPRDVTARARRRGRRRRRQRR